MKNKKGSSIITAPIIVSIGVVMVAILIVFSAETLMPYIWYEKLSSTCIKYVFIMEEYGYLTSKEKETLERELEKQGFDKNAIDIACTSNRQNYGEPIYLNISYNYRYKLPILGEKSIPMNIKKQSVSKR